MARNKTERKNKEIAPRQTPKVYETICPKQGETPSSDGQCLYRMEPTCQTACDPPEAALLTIQDRLSRGDISEGPIEVEVREDYHRHRSETVHRFMVDWEFKVVPIP